MRPAGLTILCALTAASALAGLYYVVHPEGAMIFAGKTVEGLAFRAYYLMMSLASFASACGIFRLRRWGLVLFLCVVAWSGLLMALNIATVDATVLERAGWSDPAAHVGGYRYLQGIGLVVASGLCAWALRYAKLLQPGLRSAA